MCLYIKTGCKIEITDKPILCRKVVAQGNTENSWISCFMNTEHEYNKELQAVEHIERETLLPHLITLGFHAHLYNEESKEKVNNRIDLFSTEERKLVEVFAIIPRGAEFCLGNNEDIVANRMIVFSSKEEYEKYIKS
jgi:hypothetical protein